MIPEKYTEGYNIQVEDGQRSASRFNSVKCVLRHLIIKLSWVKVKEKGLKTFTEKKQLLGSPIHMTTPLRRNFMGQERERHQKFFHYKELKKIRQWNCIF